MGRWTPTLPKPLLFSSCESVCEALARRSGGDSYFPSRIAHFEREGFDAGSLGLHLDEAKALPGRLQRSMVDAQAVEAMARMSVCPECGSRLTVKGHHFLVYRSLFGRLSIDSPRL